MTNAKTPRRLRGAAITGLAATALGGGVIVATNADAASSSKAKSTRATTSTTQQAPTPPDPAQEHARFAKALGVSEEKLTAAEAQVRSDRLDAAVKAGKLTSKQKSLLDELYATGLDLPLPPGIAPAPGSGDDPDTALAKALGISVDKVRAARPGPPAGGPPTPPSGGPAAGPGAGAGAPTPPSGSSTARGKRSR